MLDHFKLEGGFIPAFFVPVLCATFIYLLSSFAIFSDEHLIDAPLTSVEGTVFIETIYKGKTYSKEFIEKYDISKEGDIINYRVEGK